MTAPTSSAQTYWLGSLPHLRFSYNETYSAAITEVTLQRTEEGPSVTYTVDSGEVRVFPADVVVSGHGTYSENGTYIWTIKAEGYTDEVVTVIVDGYYNN